MSSSGAALVAPTIQGGHLPNTAALQKHRPSDHPSAEGLPLPPIPDGFGTHDAGWIHFAYHPSIRSHIEPLKASADEIRRELSDMLGTSVLRRVHVRIARTPGEMRTLAPPSAGFPKYASGVAYSELGLVLLTEQPRYPGEQHELLEIFRHELAHIALHDAVDRRNVPRWFNEGFAVHASGEAFAARVQSLWTATLAGRLLPLSDLTDRFPADSTTASVAYAEAADIVRYLLRTHDAHRFRALISRMEHGQSFEDALSDSYSTDLASLEHEWRQDVARRYTFWPVLFGGTSIWVVALGLFVWGWRRKRARTRRTLDRWGREEAAEDARRAALAAIASDHPVHIVLHRPEGGPTHSPAEASAPSKRDVPKVEHDGDWHTLH